MRKDEVRNKKNISRGLLRALALTAALALMLMALAGCKAEETTLQNLLPRESVTEAAVSFLNEGLGDNIPQLRYAAGSEEFVQLCDLLYAAQPVQVEIQTNYSPELNASQEIYLATAAGTMTVYYDDYQNLINVPINRKVDGQSVRVYMSFQSADLPAMMQTLQAALPEPEPAVDPAAEQNPGFPPDDSALRAQLDMSAVLAAGTPIGFEQASCLRESDGAVYYVYNSDEKTELPQDKVLVTAVPQSTETRQAAVASIEENDACIRVTVALSDLAEGEAPVPAAVLCDTDCLRSLPAAVFADGAAEAIKTGVLSGETLFSLFEDGTLTDAPAEVIARCIRYKAGVVERDEKERGERRKLNLGHTVGHAIEKCSGYAIPHGHAVAAGLAVMARASERLGWAEPGVSARIAACLEKNGLPTGTDYPAEALAKAALADKKRSGDSITIVVPRAIGDCELKRIPVTELLPIIAAGLGG